MKGCVIIPTLNEIQIIHDLVIQIRSKGLDVLVVDDGSSDGTGASAKKAGAKVIFHPRNRGKAAALRTGFQSVINDNYDFIITMDGDGQHSPEDIKNFIENFSKFNTDIIVGNRMDEPKNMPFHRWITNKVTSMIISSICKMYIPDTQNGFRLIKTSALKDMVFSTSNYEIEAELLIQGSKKHYKIDSVPIETIYSGQSSQINPVVDTIRFFRFIFKDQIKEGWFILKEFFNDTVIKYGSVIFLVSLLCNFLNLVFWLFMVRKLSHIDYGVLNTMSSFLMISGLPTVILNTVLVKYFSEFKALNKKKEIQALFHAFLKRILIINFIIFVLLISFSKNIANFLNLESKMFIYFSTLFIIFSNLSILTIGMMRGMQLFYRIAINSIFLVCCKLFIGVLLVLAGFKAFGAFLGFILSAMLAYFLSLFQLPRWVYQMKRKEYVKYKLNLKLKNIYGYFIPVGIALISYSIFINSDIILVKHFFSPTKVGIYSISQTVGKILLFMPSAVILVFFPVAVQKEAQNENTTPLIKRSILFVSSMCIMVALFTFIFPRFVLRVISGKVIPECIPIVRLMIFPMSLFALNYIFIFYNLTLKNMRFIYSIFAVSILQIILIFLFHNSLIQIVSMMCISSSIAFYLGIRSVSLRKTSK